MGNHAFGRDLCIGCGELFDVNSNVQMYCTTECRRLTLHPPKGARQGACSDCPATITVPAGKRGPLPKRCPECKAVFERHRPSRRGKPKPKPKKARVRKYQPGPVDGTCLTLLRYDESNTAYGFFACECGNEKRIQLRYVFQGYPAAAQRHDRAKTCGDPSQHVDKRHKGEDIAYSTAHHRLVDLYGSALTLPCGKCRDIGDGQWAYLWSSEAPKVQPEGVKDAGLIYSADGSDYTVLCRSCHSHWDKASSALLKGAPKGTVSGIHVALKAVGYLDNLTERREAV